MAITTASKLLTDGDMGASITTDPIELTRSQLASLQAVWDGTGTPVGTLTLEASANYGEPAGSNWDDVSSLSVPALPAVSGAGQASIGLVNIPFLWVRLKYTRTSGGTGAKLNVWAHQKSGV